VVPNWSPRKHASNRGSLHGPYSTHCRKYTRAKSSSGYPNASADPHLPPRQGKNRYTGLVHAATDSVKDAEYDLLGRHFVGTDHVFRLNHTRVEAFSGVASDLFEDLEKQQLDQYRRKIHSDWQDRQRVAWDRTWRGPVSILDDGTALAIRLLDTRDS